MRDAPFIYQREDWFGPESFAAVVLGMICISLPYTGLAPRDATWLIWGPLLAGLVLVIFRGNARRFGTGLLAAFAGFVLSLIGLLIGLSVGHAFG